MSRLHPMAVENEMYTFTKTGLDKSRTPAVAARVGEIANATLGINPLPFRGDAVPKAGPPSCLTPPPMQRQANGHVAFCFGD